MYKILWYINRYYVYMTEHTTCSDAMTRDTKVRLKSQWCHPGRRRFLRCKDWHGRIENHENHEKTLGNPWENHRKHRGNQRKMGLEAKQVGSDPIKAWQFRQLLPSKTQISAMDVGMATRLCIWGWNNACLGVKTMASGFWPTSTIAMIHHSLNGTIHYLHGNFQ